jgi:copper chaperone CopZ
MWRLIMQRIAINFVAAFALFMGATSAFAVESVRVTVNGMVCAFCAQGIEKRLQRMSASDGVYVDLKNRLVAMQIKPGQTVDDKALTAEITDAGYDVVKIERVAKTVADIRRETAAKK